MDAHALLTSQGWRGTGHSLHPTSDTNGLSKPLLVSLKQNTLGVGKKQHKTSDMWWMNAFDSSLKGLDTSKEGVVVQTLTSGGLDMVARGGGKYVGKGGLYASFVRGECLSGTLTPEEVEENKREKEKAQKAEENVSDEGKKKRKRDEGKDSKEERRAKKAALRKASDSEDMAVKEPEVESASGSSEEVKETKEERRARKAAKRASKEQTVIIQLPKSTQVEIPETKEERKERKRLKKVVQEDGKAEREVEVVEIAKPETREGRKERKQLKKLAQEASEMDSEVSSEKSKKKKRRKE